MPKKRSDHKFSLVLPVLFYEYLAISITKSLIPKMILDYYGDWSYVAVGLIETAKGCLAFISCPIFGRLSDRIGRKYCLLVTVIGTTLPVCMMAFTDNMIVYAIMMSLSGFFRYSNRHALSQAATSNGLLPCRIWVWFDTGITPMLDCWLVLTLSVNTVGKLSTVSSHHLLILLLAFIA